MQLAIFPGKGMTIKRYQAYFPMFNLCNIGDTVTTHTTMALCHSRGLIDAILYCGSHDISPKIICMDGSDIPPQLYASCIKYEIIAFRPIHKQFYPDSECFSQIIYYNIDEKIRHYPYMDKNIRDKIVKCVNR